MMKKILDGDRYFFVDESGDPTFYDKHGNYIVGKEHGSSKLLIMGVVELDDPQTMRSLINHKKEEVCKDPRFSSICSIKKTKVAFHAKNDHKFVRDEFFNLIPNLDFKASFVVARKNEKTFKNSFRSDEGEFYDHLITKLFETKLHTYKNNHIYFSKRGSSTRQGPIEHAIQKSIKKFENKWNTEVRTNIIVQAQTPSGEPCLSLVDYMNWAVSRCYTHSEMHYFDIVRGKVSLVIDPYDIEKYPKNYYSKKNPFDIKKITPL